MYGFYGRILKIDLNKEAFSIESIGDHILKTCLEEEDLVLVSYSIITRHGSIR